MTSADAIEIETGASPCASVIWMHGLGADGNDFVPIVRELDLPRLPIRFVFPHAPMQPVTINGGYVMRAWYDIVSTDLARREDEGGVRASQRIVETLIDREVERGSAPGQIVLAGFSQGGAMALHTGLRHRQRLAGIMALSTYVPMLDKLDGERHDANASAPIFMAHGSADPIVPLAHAIRSRDALISLGHEVEWHEYAMPHSVCIEEIAAIGAWMKRVLPA